MSDACIEMTSDAGESVTTLGEREISPRESREETKIYAITLSTPENQ